MAKDKTLSSPKKKTTTSTVTPMAHKAPVDTSDKYKDALQDIVNISDKLDTDPLNRNIRVMLQDAIAKAKTIL